jgi:hypothetical protein
MLSRIAVILCFVGSLMLLWAGCSGGDQACVKGAADVAAHGLAELGEACVHDSDCQSEFCDRGQCNESIMAYGYRCVLPASVAHPVDRQPERLCDGYLCLSGRCRSCRSDAECQSYLGTEKCTVVADAEGWPRRAVCRPATPRRPLYDTCTEDAQCKTLFCDRTTCAKIGRVSNYGEDCMPGPPKPPPEGVRIPAEGTCEGYLCVDGRCRSCKEDAECQDGSGELKCIGYDSWSGKVCVTPSESARNPRTVVSVAPSRLAVDAEGARTDPRVPPAPRSPSRCP